MSEPITPLGGAAIDGRVRVEELPRRGMITLRGDLGAAGMAEAVNAVNGLAVPARGRAEIDGAALAGWMSPDELMLMLPPEGVAAALEAIGQALAGSHHLAAELTDARALLRISGPDAAVRESLSKLAPVDFSPAAFPAGTFRRSRLAQVPAAFWCEGEGVFGVMCFRSVARYALAALGGAAAEDGAVGYF